MKARQPTVLLLVERRDSRLTERLSKAGYRVIETYTTDRAVAVCVNNPVNAVILHQDLFVETDGWSVAQSLKAVKPEVCVLLITEAKKLTTKLPEGVDAIVAAAKSAEVLAELQRLLK